MAKGLIHIYTGDGKGKTTAAVGISLRAKSRGLNTLFVQFFKEPNSSSEVALLRELGISTIIFDKVKSPFFNPDIDKGSLRAEALKALNQLRQIFSENRFDLVVLDEFICLIMEEVLSEDEAIDFMRSRPENLEVVLTGQGATKKITDIADYVTFMQNIKHPYEKKTKARMGIEY